MHLGAMQSFMCQGLCLDSLPNMHSHSGDKQHKGVTETLDI